VATGDRTTLLVAVAGIAATALVGLAGTTASWLSARDDRATQRALARDERTYERRVAIYLDAIDFVEAQRKSYEDYVEELRKVELDDREYVSITFTPPSRLTSRLRAFGSKKVFNSFQETQGLHIAIGASTGCCPEYLDVTLDELDDRTLASHSAFREQVTRFEDTVNEELNR
jgi:hypothetical protein